MTAETTPVSCAHEAYQGQCAHCGVPIVNGFPKYPAVQPAAGREALSKIIRQRLLGVAPDDQDVVLEDDDWRLILAALSAPQAAPGEGEQS